MVSMDVITYTQDTINSVKNELDNTFLTPILNKIRIVNNEQTSHEGKTVIIVSVHYCVYLIIIFENIMI